MTESYIPGSFILGAFARAYIENQKPESPPHGSETFRNLFLDGSVRFSNAYPVTDPKEKPFCPSPVSIVKKKDVDEYFDTADEFDFEDLQNQKIQTKGNIGEFVQINNGEITTHSSAIQVEYHHRRPTNRGIGHAVKELEKFKSEKDPGEFFQYTVLKPDQSFNSNIIGKYKYIKKLQEILNKQNIFYLGKSKTAQYGRCIINGKIEEIINDSDKQWGDGECTVFTLKSDIILRNKNGFIVPDPEILKDEIADFLEANREQVTIKKSFLKFKQIGGFLGVWNMPKIQATALAAGSVLVCKNQTSGDLDIGMIENHSFGVRTEEGFGRIKVNWHGWDGVKLVDKKSPSYDCPDEISKSAELIKYILEKRLKEYLKNEAVVNAKKMKKANKTVTNSFIGKMLLLINKSNDFEQLKIQLNKLRDRAKKQLDTIHPDLFLKIENKYFKVNEDKIKDKLIYLKDSNKLPVVRDILNLAQIGEEFYKNNIFILYKEYANHFLNLIKLHNRNRKAVESDNR